MQVRKKVLGVGAESTTLLVQDNEANGELRVVRRVNVAKWKQEELSTALEFYLTLMQHKLSHFVPIYAVTHSGQYLNITTAYFSKGDLNSYVEDECDAPLRTQQILRWGLFLACAIHELNAHTQLHFYGLELDRIFMTSQTDIIAGLPMLPTHYWQVLRNRQGDGVAVERQYPLETLSSESYYGELTDVWHLGQVLQTLLSAHCHYSARPASVRELIALMMETNYTRRLPIIEVIAKLEKLVNSSTHNNSNKIIAPLTSTSTTESSSNHQHHQNGESKENNKRSKEERSTSSASSQLRSLHKITSTNTNSHSSRDTHNKETQRTPSREPNVVDVNNNHHHHRESSARFDRRESANKFSRTPSGTPSSQSSPQTALSRWGEHVMAESTSHTLASQHSEEKVVSEQTKETNENNTKATDGKVKCVYATRKPSPCRVINKQTVNGKENNKNDMPNTVSIDNNNNTKITNSNKASDELRDKRRLEKLTKQVKESKSSNNNNNNVNNIPIRNAPQVSSARRFRSTSANNNINGSSDGVKDNEKIKRTNNNTNNTSKVEEINGAHKHVTHEVFNDSWEQHVLQELEEVQRLNVSTPLPQHHTRNLQALSRHATPTSKLIQISPRESASSHTSNEKVNKLKSNTNNIKNNNNNKKSERKNVYEEVNKSWQAHVNLETAHRTPYPIEHSTKENNEVRQRQVNEQTVPHGSHRKRWNNEIEQSREEESSISITQSYQSSDAEWKRLREMHEARIAQRTQAQRQEQKQRRMQRQQQEEEKENINANRSSNNDNNETNTEQTKARTHSKETLERIMEWKRQAASNTDNNNNSDNNKIVNTQELEQEQQQQLQHHGEQSKTPNFTIEMRVKPHEDDKAHELRRAEIARHHKRNENIPVTVMLPPHTRADANTSAMDKESISHNNKENEKPQLARFNTAPEISTQQAKLYNNNNSNTNNQNNADKKSNNSSVNMYSHPAKGESNSQHTSTSQSTHSAKMAVEALNVRAAPVIGNRSRLAVKANNDNNNNHVNKSSNISNNTNKDNNSNNINSVNAEKRINNEEKEVDKNGNRESETRNKILQGNNNINGKGNTSNKNTLLHSTAPLPQHASPRESRLPQQVNKKEAVWHVTSNPVVKEGKAATDETKAKECKNAAFASSGAPTLPFARNKSGIAHSEQSEQQSEQPKNKSVEHEKQQHDHNKGNLPHHNAPSANHSTHNTSPPSSSSSAIGETRKQTTTALASLEWNVDGLRSSIRSLLHNREMYGDVLATIHRFLDESEEVRSSAHANRQFMTNIRRVVADDHIYNAAAPLCAQLVALEGVSRSIHEMQ